MLLRLLAAAAIVGAGALLEPVIPLASLAGLFLAPLAWIGTPLGRKLLLLALTLAIAYVLLSRGTDRSDAQYGLWVLGFVIWTILALGGTAVAAAVDGYLSTRRRIRELEAGPPPGA